VIANLLTNAARYTDPEGYIAITAARENDVLMLTVTDNGVGIDPELLPRIFDLFVQDTRTSDRGQGGLGIGLTLIRSLVQLHGGTVTAHSPGVGRGSEFRVRLPALVGEALAPPPAPAPARRLISMRTRRVLLVDDNADAADLLADFLREAGHEVVLAHDGAQALRALETFSPEVALLDIGLPVMDGYELAARLRDRLPLRLAALTGYGQDHDRARSLTAGFHAHFVKPVAPQALLEYIDGTPPETRS
jgi:CheY-like chemotaxis protein